MHKLIWVTDIHLNFVELVYSILIGGDIAEAKDLMKYLKILEDLLKCPIYFVLGNHDFYHGSIREVREKIMDLVKTSGFLNWLPACGVVRITDKTCLIGHGSWADGRLGDYYSSEVWLNDYVLIKELKGLNKEERLIKLNELGDRAAR